MPVALASSPPSWRPVQLLVPAGAAQRLYSDAAQLVAGAAAVTVCLVTRSASGRASAVRRWRVLLAVGLTGWTLVRAGAVARDVIDAGRAPIGSVADVGFLCCRSALFLALLAAAARCPGPVPTLPAAGTGSCWSSTAC